MTRIYRLKPGSEVGSGPKRDLRDEPVDDAVDVAIDRACEMLQLPAIRDAFRECADEAAWDGLSYREFLAKLLLAECESRGLQPPEQRLRSGHR